MQTKGSSSTARLELEPKAVASRAGMRPVYTALPLLPLPPPDQCQPMGFLTPFRLLVSDLFGSHWLPAACPTFLGAHFSTLHCKLPQVSSTVHCTSSWRLLQAQLWLASFYRCQVFMLEGTYLSNCSCLLYVLSHLVTPFHTTWCELFRLALYRNCFISLPLLPISKPFLCVFPDKVSYGLLQRCYLCVSCHIPCSITRRS